MDHGDEEMEEDESTDVYLPGDPVDASEELVRDETTYVLYHEAQTGKISIS